MPPKGQGQGQSQGGSGKPYSAAVNDICKHTAMQPSDIDAKAFQLLDALHAAGRLEPACAHLKKSLEDLPRDKVANWTPFVFTLLKKFDPAFYAEMRDSRGRPKNRRSKKSQSPVRSAPLNPAAPVFVPGQRWVGADAEPMPPPLDPPPESEAPASR
mmetsp:Transcript_56644/g.127830  ORF Transcript_56644/g.127830 Transcript_56644/m.127830 type:complete len:157 (-) Transcript_56644:216-686(-)